VAGLAIRPNGGIDAAFIGPAENLGPCLWAAWSPCHRRRPRPRERSSLSVHHALFRPIRLARETERGRRRSSAGADMRRLLARRRLVQHAPWSRLERSRGRIRGQSLSTTADTNRPCRVCPPVACFPASDGLLAARSGGHQAHPACAFRRPCNGNAAYTVIGRWTNFAAWAVYTVGGYSRYVRAVQVAGGGRRLAVGHRASGAARGVPGPLALAVTRRGDRQLRDRLRQQRERGGRATIRGGLLRASRQRRLRQVLCSRLTVSACRNGRHHPNTSPASAHARPAGGLRDRGQPGAWDAGHRARAWLCLAAGVAARDGLVLPPPPPPRLFSDHGTA